MAVRALVDRHAVDRNGEIGAVIEVHAAQEILVGFALAAVLRDDQTRRALEQFTRPVIRPRLDLPACDGALTG